MTWGPLSTSSQAWITTRLSTFDTAPAAQLPAVFSAFVEQLHKHQLTWRDLAAAIQRGGIERFTNLPNEDDEIDIPGMVRLFRAHGDRECFRPYQGWAVSLIQRLRQGRKARVLDFKVRDDLVARLRLVLSGEIEPEKAGESKAAAKAAALFAVSSP